MAKTEQVSEQEQEQECAYVRWWEDPADPDYARFHQDYPEFGKVDNEQERA